MVGNVGEVRQKVPVPILFLNITGTEMMGYGLKMDFN